MTEVQDNSEKSRIDILVDGHVAGFVNYQLGIDMIAFTHTEVEKAYSGQGLAKKLVKGALEQARMRGLSVRPFCPYVRKVIAEDQENDYLDLVQLSDRGQFGLPG